MKTALRMLLLDQQTTLQSYLAGLNPNLLNLWPLTDVSGTTALSGKSGGWNGTYSGVALGSSSFANGEPVGLWGASDYCNVYNAALNAGIGATATKKTLMIWLKVRAASVWTDATLRRIMSFRVDASNWMVISRSATNNQIDFNYIAGGTNKVVGYNTSSTGWIQVAMTVDTAADQCKFFAQGAQTGATQTGLGTFAGNFDTTLCCLGAISTAGAGNFDGYLAYAGLWSDVLTPAQIQGAYNFLPPS